MASLSDFPGRIKTYIGTIPILVPIVALVFSGTYFVGFLSVIGFWNIGILSLTDLTKSALQWSPFILIVAIIAIPIFIAAEEIIYPLKLLLIQQRNGHTIDRDIVEEELKKLAPLVNRFEKIGTRLTVNIKIKYIILSLCAALSAAFMSTYFADKNQELSVIVISIFVVAIHVAPIIGALKDFQLAVASWILLISLLFLIFTYVVGRDAAVNLIFPSTDKEATSSILIDGNIIYTRHYVTLDYYTIINKSYGSISFIKNDRISEIESTKYCDGGYLRCRLSHR